MATRRAISGARARLSIGSNVVGWATGVSAQETISLQPVEVLGEIDVQEHEPIGRTVTMNADYVRIDQESLQKQGYWPTGSTKAVVEMLEMTAELIDVVTNKVIYKLEGVKPETRSWRLDRGGLMTLNASFRARRMHAGDAPAAA